MKRTIAFGTFDFVHPGHKSFLNQAKKLGAWLLVVVARDHHVKNSKGNLPHLAEKKRLLDIRKLKIADKVILGSKTHNYFRTLRTYKINTIALGYDQKPTVRELRKQLKKHSLGKITVRRLRALKPEVYKSSKLKSKG